MALSAQAQAGPLYREATQELGIVNGAVVANQMVEITRLLPDPVLFRVERNEVDQMPTMLILRRAQATTAPEGSLLAKIEWSDGHRADGRERRIEAELPLRLRVDGADVRPTLRIRGPDLELALPPAAQQVALFSDGPVRFRAPAWHRGELKLTLDILASVGFKESGSQ
nr:DUF5462 family protein [Chromobacterium piscinae]